MIAKNNKCIGYHEESGVDPVYIPATKTRTQQQFRGINDLNVILGNRHPSEIPMQAVQGMQSDNSDVPTSLLDAEEKSRRLREAFQNIPSNVRDQFENNPYKMLRFLDDENNREAAVKMGLIKPAPGPEIITPQKPPA